MIGDQTDLAWILSGVRNFGAQDEVIGPLVLTAFQLCTVFEQVEQVHRQAFGLTGRKASAVGTVSLTTTRRSSDSSFRKVLSFMKRCCPSADKYSWQCIPDHVAFVLHSQDIFSKH